MRYLKDLSKARTFRDEVMVNDIKLFHQTRTKLIDAEKRIIKVIQQFNNPTSDKATDKKIRCYPRYRKNNIKSAIVNRIVFEVIEVVDGKTERKTLTASSRWSRVIAQTTIKNKYKYRSITRKEIKKLHEDYSQMSAVLDSVIKFLSVLGIPNEEVKLLPANPRDENSHLPNKLLMIASKRSFLLSKSNKSISYYADRLITVENELDRYIKSFNFSFSFNHQGLIYSWVYRDKLNPLRVIEHLCLWHIQRPINERGVRARYKKRVKNLNREFIRECGLKRHSRKLLKANKKIKNQINEWENIRSISIQINSLLKTLVAKEERKNANIKCYF